MDLNEYLLFIPLLLFGIGLSEGMYLIGRLVGGKTYCLPAIITLIFLVEITIFVSIRYLFIFKIDESSNYAHILIYLLNPIILMLCLHFLKEMENEEGITWDQFSKHADRIFYVLGFGLFMQFFLPVPQTLASISFRIIGILISLSIAYFHKKWMYYGLFLFWLIFFIYRLFMPITLTP
jgi:hypothetical protein